MNGNDGNYQHSEKITENLHMSTLTRDIIEER